MIGRRLERANSIKSFELTVIPPPPEELCDIKEETKNEENLPTPPPDHFFLVGLMVIFLGLTSTLVTTFIITANDYWMYKLRDPSSETYDANNRTVLQANFATSIGVADVIPTIFGLIFTMTYAQKIKSRTRIIFCYIFTTLTFVFLTVCVNADTDSWQLAFFGTVVILSGLNILMMIILTASIIVMVPKFPPYYLKLFMYGQGLSSLFSALLQVICLAAADDSLTVGLIYFASGTAMYIVSMILYIGTRYLPFYKHYINDKEEDTKRPLPTLRQIGSTLRIMWPVLGIMGLSFGGHMLVHPKITSLVVSEYYGEGNAWGVKYFVPVVTYCMTSVVETIGRVFAKDSITRKTFKWIFVVVALRMVLFPTFVVFCNVQTNDRKLEPLFIHDWEYILIIIVFSSAGGYFATCCVLSLPNFMNPNESKDLHYLLLQVTMIIFGIILAPLAAVLINYI